MTRLNHLLLHMMTTNMHLVT